MYLILEKTINGVATDFERKIKSKCKKHVITSNYSFRKGQIVDIIISDDNEIGNSEKVASLPIVSTQTISIVHEKYNLHIFIDGILMNYDQNILFKNEGIEKHEFIHHNFKNDYGKIDGIIIHFTSIQY